jgi:hypothetical protein
VLQPTILGKAADVSGFLVIASVLVFGTLLGVVGAIIAVDRRFDPDRRPGAHRKATSGDGSVTSGLDREVGRIRTNSSST